jgi:hypothetical protein
VHVHVHVHVHVLIEWYLSVTIPLFLSEFRVFYLWGFLTASKLEMFHLSSSELIHMLHAEMVLNLSAIGTLAGMYAENSKFRRLGLRTRAITPCKVYYTCKTSDELVEGCREMSCCSSMTGDSRNAIQRIVISG